MPGSPSKVVFFKMYPQVTPQNDHRVTRKPNQVVWSGFLRVRFSFLHRLVFAPADFESGIATLLPLHGGASQVCLWALQKWQSAPIEKTGIRHCGAEEVFHSRIRSPQEPKIKEEKSELSKTGSLVGTF